MRSSLYALPQNTVELAGILDEVDRCAAANGLERKKALQLRLLAEELNGVLPALLKVSEGTFWLENEGNHYQLHVSLNAAFASAAQQDMLIALSASGKNAAAEGIMGKIRFAAEKALLSLPGTRDCWSLKEYRHRVKNEKEKTAELERSIIANLADDVTVAIRGNRVGMTIHKHFWQ